MGERLALMVRPGRRMAPRPAGAIFLIGELAEGLTRKDLDRALAKGALEITDAPAEPEPVVEPVVVEEPAAEAPEIDAPERVDPYDGKPPEERAGDLDAARIADEEARDAAEKDKPAAPVLPVEEEVALLVKEYSKDQLKKIAAGEKTEISPRGTKPEIALDIVRARRA